MGYDENFLGGAPVPMPTLTPRLQAVSDCGASLDHTRFSVIFHHERSLAVCTAHTIDGSAMLAEGTIPRKDRFRFDDLIENDLQLDNDRGYRHNPWDRGHLVRRRSLHWGDEQEARDADSESYFWTNIAPQHERLHHTTWGPIEDWMLDKAETTMQRAAVFTGPVLTEDDPEHVNDDGERPFQVPAGFWKIVVIPHQGSRSVAAFVVWQRDHDSIHPVSFDPMLEQVRLTTVEFLTGLSFVELRPFDPLAFGGHAGAHTATLSGPRAGRPILSPADITLL
ncbi:MAG: DNA/RNA non-specific endonuclease [Acidimicrobiales bacterium]